MFEEGKAYAIAILIDTQWNVNKCGKRMVNYDSRNINRYIVECKFILAGKTMGALKILIDTQWNVNVGMEANYVTDFQY